MALITEVSSYVTSAVITAAGQNANEDRIFEFLGGVSTNLSGKIVFSGTDPVLELDQQSTGHILKLTKAAADKFIFTDDGVLEIYIANGTKPIDVKNSLTMCDNLNADMVDGLHASEVGQLNSSIQIPADVDYIIPDDKNLIIAAGTGVSYKLTLPTGLTGYDITIIKSFNSAVLTVETQVGSVINELATIASQTVRLTGLRETIRIVNNNADTWWVVNRYET